MVLVLQTNIPGRLSVWLLDRKGGVAVERHRETRFHESERLLQLVDEVIRQAPKKTRIQKIAVVRGPGPFTAVRTGLIVANTMSQVSGIPIIGTTATSILVPTQLRTLTKRSGTQTLSKPFYGKAPNITKAKRRT